MTAAAMASVACTISGASDVRQDVAQRDAQGGLPTARAAST